MATFAKSTFSAASYASFRPSYPATIYKTILDYHQGPRKLCLDLGTGHGLVARSMAQSFSKVIGTDPSAGMIKQAKSGTTPQNVEFRTSSAEDMSWIGDDSLDIVVSGQAAHWFDYSDVWPELKRKVRKGGSLAFWAYKDNVFVDFPKATKILDHYCYGDGPEFMGMYWEQPGRSIIRDLFRAIVPPESDWTDIVRIEYEPDIKGPESGSLGTRLMHKKMTLGQMEGYTRTFSGFHGWQEAHPQKKSKAEGGEGDLIDEMFEKMLEAEDSWRAKGETWRDVEIESEWGSVILLARKS